MYTTNRRETYWLRFTRRHLEDVNLLLRRYWSLQYDEYERDRCIEAILNLLRPLIAHAARSNHQHRSQLGLDVDDFEVYVEVAVYKAVVSYDPDRNDNFLAYLYRLVNNETMKFLDSELPISPSVFHQLNSPDLDPRDAEVGAALLYAESLSSYNDRDIEVSVPSTHPFDTSELSEEDGQQVLVELFRSE